MTETNHDHGVGKADRSGEPDDRTMTDATEILAGRLGYAIRPVGLSTVALVDLRDALGSVHPVITGTLGRVDDFLRSEAARRKEG